MKKVTVLLTILSTLFLFLNGCTANIYNEEWVIGKTPDEIMEEYGEPYGIYYYTDSTTPSDTILRIQYMTKEKRIGFLGTDPAEYFAIWFNRDGKAYRAEKNWVPPGG